MAFAMGVGILLDSFLVRSLLVPALIVLFGAAGTWPRAVPEAPAPAFQETQREGRVHELDRH
jgi:RND superfamily putative drug exporter